MQNKNKLRLDGKKLGKNEYPGKLHAHSQQIQKNKV